MSSSAAFTSGQPTPPDGKVELAYGLHHVAQHNSGFTAEYPDVVEPQPLGLGITYVSTNTSLNLLETVWLTLNRMTLLVSTTVRTGKTYTRIPVSPNPIRGTHHRHLAQIRPVIAVVVLEAAEPSSVTTPLIAQSEMTAAGCRSHPGRGKTR